VEGFQFQGALIMLFFVLWGLWNLSIWVMEFALGAIFDIRDWIERNT